MDLYGLIRTLAILLNCLWAYRFFFEKGHSSRKAEEQQQKPPRPKSTNKKLKDDVGEYVDYEEVK